MAIVLWRFSAVLLVFSFAIEIYATTHIKLTNNTKSDLVVESILQTNDEDFQKGKDWNEAGQIISPYATKEVLWFSRNAHLKENMDYQYNVIIKRSDQNAVVLNFNVRGKKVYGSELNAQLHLPDMTTIPMLTDKNFEKYQANFWGRNFEIFARNYLPAGEVFRSYQIVIHEPNDQLQAVNNKELSVLTYNTQLMPFYAEIVDRLNHPKTRATDIPNFISHYDVVILQELFDRELRNKISKEMQGYYPYMTQVVGKNTNKILTGGVIIFSKWPILKEAQIIYHAGSKLDRLAAKGAAYALINKEGQIYHLLGTHLQSGSSKQEKNSRQQQLHELNNFITSLQIPVSEPVIIGGDFNISEEKIAETDLFKILNVYHIKNIGFPYSCDGVLNTMNVGNDRSRLDFIFASNKHLLPKQAYNKVIILRDLENEAMWPNFDLSDHFPVEAYFSF